MIILRYWSTFAAIMKILFVLNAMYVKGQGISQSALITSTYLKMAGIDVRVLTMEMPGSDCPKPDYPMKKFHFPLFQKLIESQGFCYASSHRKQIREAVAWADVIHVMEPFVLERKALVEAKKQGKACVATYHLHPENILSSLGMGSWKFANNLLLKFFVKCFFNCCSDVQCPSDNVVKRLNNFGFNGSAHRISNGIEIEDNIVPAVPQTDPYIVVCVGRFSLEKDQQTLIKAMPLCRHKDEIQFVFAGKGPKQAEYERTTNKYFISGILKHKPQYRFCSKSELKELVRKSYLAIHCATIEVEGLSIMDAACQGTIPVVADCSISAASQFTLSPESRFPVRDAKTLAERIDWWIEHPTERKEMSSRYIGEMKKYDINKSIVQLIDMYQLAFNKIRQ